MRAATVAEDGLRVMLKHRGTLQSMSLWHAPPTVRSLPFSVLQRPYIYHRSGNFVLKIIRVENFRVNKFSRFCSISKITLTVNGYYVDEHLESS